MRAMRLKTAVLGCALIFAAIQSEAVERVNRMNKPFLIGVGLNSAGPVGGGPKIGYTFKPWMRGEIGHSTLSMTTGVSVNDSSVSSTETKFESVAGAAKFFVPTWNFTPALGLHAAKYKLTSDINTDSAEINGMKGEGTQTYASLGMDWQSQGGFNTDFGLNVPLGGSMISTIFVNLGWAFDIF